HRADDKSPRSNKDRQSRRWKLLRSEVEHQIHHRQPEKRDVTKPIQPAFETAVAAEPVFAMEFQAEERSRAEAQDNSKPGQEQIQLCRVSRHVRKFGLIVHALTAARKYPRSRQRGN